MKKIPINKNVYEAFLERIDYIFKEFDNIYVSFSGGKDSGLLFNLAVDYIKQNCPHRKIGVFHQDFEAQYEKTTEYVTKMFEEHADYIDPYWVCLPMKCKTPMSNYSLYWYPWDDEDSDSWIRSMPDKPYIINLDNNILDYYEYKMPHEELYRGFSRWYHKIRGGGKTACLLGIRADESLTRYSSFVNKKNLYNGQTWITEIFKDVYTVSPLYDWRTNDVWTANARFSYTYNGIYDLYYKAGLNVSQMRVASPFNEWAVQSLNIYRVIEPHTWTKLVGRIQGANFACIYGKTKAMGYRSLILPQNHTWQSYTIFLLSTLPKHTRDMYIEKFKTSIKFWSTVGGGLPNEVIKELIEKGYKIKTNGVSNYTKDGKYKVVFKQKIPDHTDNIKSTINIPSWKRMCFCILKNDHYCRFMGFGLSSKQNKTIKILRDKYKKFLEEETEDEE